MPSRLTAGGCGEQHVRQNGRSSVSRSPRSYIVDDTASDSGALCMEPGVSAELEADYGIGPNISPGHNPATDAFYADLIVLFQVCRGRQRV